MNAILCLNIAMIMIFINFYLILVFLNEVVLPSDAQLPHYRLIIDLFKYKNINTIYLQTCDYISATDLMKFISNDFSFTINMNCPRSMLNYPKNNQRRNGIFLDLSCISNVEFLKLATKEDLFNLNNEWIIWLENKNNISLLEESGLSVSSETTAIVNGTNLYDLYRTDINTRLIRTPVGNWSRDYVLSYHREPRVPDFQRETLYGGIFFVQDVFDHKNLTEQLQDWAYRSNKDIVNRYFYVLNLHIADLYNFTLELVVTDSWGDLQPNESYSGLLGQLQRKVSNISVGPLLMLPARAKSSEFLPPMLEYWMPFVFRQPRALGTYRALSLPLMPVSWVTLVFTLVLATLMFHQIRANDGSQPTISESFVQFIGIFTQQGLVRDPGTTSGRLICLSMLIMATLVMLFYNAATMTALLSSTPPKIRQLNQLVSSDIPLTLADAPYFNNKLARSRVLEESVIKKVDKHSPKLFSVQEGLNIVLKGGAFCAEVFTIYEAIAKTFKDDQKCDLTYIPARRPFLITSLLPKYSPLRDIFTKGFIRLMEHGLSNREKSKWIVRKPKCVGKQQFIFVSLEAITIALAAFASGLIMSTFILFIEIIIAKKNKIFQKQETGPDLQLVSPLPLQMPYIN